MKRILSILGLLLAVSLQARADVITLNPIIVFNGIDFVTAPPITINVPEHGNWSPGSLSVIFQAGGGATQGLTSLSYSITSTNGGTVFDSSQLNASGAFVNGRQNYVVPSSPSLVALGAGNYELLLYGETSNPNLTGTLTTSLTPAVPEPETYALFGLGLTALLVRRRHRGGARRPMLPGARALEA